MQWLVDLQEFLAMFLPLALIAGGIVIASLLGLIIIAAAYWAVRG